MHLATHSVFFVKKWKQFSDLHCRVCEMEVSEGAFKNHMDSAHPSNLFADIDDLVTDNVLENNEDDRSFVSDNKTNLIIKEETEEIPKMKVSSSILESNQEHKLSFQPKTEYQSMQMLPSKPKLRLKPLDLLLDQSKKETNIYEREDVSSKGVKQNVLDPHQLVMQGIKKNISIKSITNFFSVKDIRIIRVSINNGSGTVTFKDVKDAAAWDGKVIKIGDCSIRTCLSKHLEACEENELRMYGITKDVSADDLHDFFLKEFCVIDDVSIQWNGQGKIVFRRREDAAAWAGKLIAVKEAKIQLKKDDPSWKKSELQNNVVERNRTRSPREEGRLRGGSDREKHWRSRSRESQNSYRSRSRESKNGHRSRSRENNKRYRSRSRDSNMWCRSKSRETKIKHRSRSREKGNGYGESSRENKLYRGFLERLKF